MPQEQEQGMPQPPEGFQRPGIRGAGNLLDPEVRGRIREAVQPLARDAAQYVAESGAGQGQGRQVVAETPPPPPQPAPGVRRLGAYPHGDVDLSYIAANVPAGPVRVQRGRAGRRFYFLPETAPAAEQPSPS